MIDPWVGAQARLEGLCTALAADILELLDAFEAEERERE